MAVRLDINANVTGTNRVNQLNRSVQNLGRASRTAQTQMAGLERAALRGRASFAALGTALRVGLVGGLFAVGFGLQRFIRDTFEAGNLIESLEIRFRLLFGSVQEGARAFDVLNEFAARVPFSLEEIAGASGNLAVISADANALANNLAITGNVAAATGLDFRQTAEQIQRAFAGGIAAADIFRERGVRAMLGFEAGVTVSVEETQRRFQEVFGEGGTFGNATQLLARTLTGQVSLVQDAYFQFRRVVQEQFFDSLTSQIRRLVGDFQTNGQRLNEIATSIGEGLANALINIENGIRFVAENWEVLNRAVQAFIAFRVVSIFGGMVAVAIQVAGAIRTMVVAQSALNVAMRANVFGLLVTAAGLAVAAVVAFRDEISNFLEPAVVRIQMTLRTLGDAFIRIVNITRRIRGLDPLATFSDRAAIAADHIHIAATESERFLRVQNNINRALDDQAANLRMIQQAAMQATAERNAELDAEIATNRALISKNALTSELTEMEVEILRIKNEILSHERATGEAVSQTAEEILKIRNATKDTADNAVDVNSAFGDLDELATDSIAAIEGQQEAWMEVQNIINNVGDSIASNIVDGIKEGQSAFDIFKNFALQALEDIARSAISNSVADILSGGSSGRSSGGSAVGGIGGIISGISGFLNLNQGGIVPGGAPYTDRVPALLTPGERVIPRNEVNQPTGGNTNITNINISGNVDQRSIDQIRSVIQTSPSQVGGANKQFTRNTAGLRNRRT